ncbi:hypothetical protein H072_10592 [Dactylellina haptotyla CBS 200.50]|uniref:Uncharacterized protein n=1 Tax=Dactylellina haptotyla (strain CBS 200.50) TaxID=1284197 RepID=S8BL18_DACHA|nr:hypothetical protein H072_10592 [Dactylellina haptotyla CBS 200.50]
MNVTLLCLFSTAGLIHTYFAVRYKTRGFSICMCIACALETSGYVGRIIAYTNPWSLPAFFIQINGIGLGPTFFAAGIYLCLTRIVIAYGANISIVQPKVYTYFFIVCDIVSLVIQLPGGIISSVWAAEGKPPTLGAHIGVAGIGFQVFSLSVWLILCAVFALKCRSVGEEAWDPRYQKMRNHWRFKIFLVGLGIAILALYIRSIYRIVELSGGYTGHLARDETAFCILEGVMIVILAFSTGIFHPGYGFGEAYSVITEQKDTFPSPWAKNAFFTKDLALISQQGSIEMATPDDQKNFPRTEPI